VSYSAGRSSTVLVINSIILLDELDHITPTSKTLDALFQLPKSYPSVLRLIGIANTHTLTAWSNVPSSSHVETLHFSPYTSDQLLQILKVRLRPLYAGETEQEMEKWLPSPTLTLLTKKVAALTGDVRSLFEVLRGAISQAVSSPTTEATVFSAATSPVRPNHVLAALKAYSLKTPDASSGPVTPSSPVNSEILSKVRGLGIQARITLLSVLLASKRVEAGLSLAVKQATASKSSDDVDLTQLYTYYSEVIVRTTDGIFAGTSRGEFNDLITMLDGLGLLTLSAPVGSASPSKKGRRVLGRTASFSAGANKGVSSETVRLGSGVRSDEVLRGLGIGEGELSDEVQEEELRTMWRRENARLIKDKKVVALPSKGSHEDVFLDAKRRLV
jgi:cell division control protein 6